SLVFFAALLGGVTAAVPQSPTPFTDSITVTATAAPEEVSKVPVTVDVIPAAEIAAQQADLAIDVLRNLPGLDVVQSGSRGKVASVFMRGTNSTHTLVLWNGIELNDPYLGGFDWSNLSTDGVERIEVVRGPFSALYGSNAVGGVVQLVTRHGARGAGARAPGDLGQARLEGGSHDLARAGASAGWNLGGLAVDLAGHLRRGKGEVDNDFFDSDEASLGLDGALGDSARLGALIRWGRSNIGVPFNFASEPSPHREQAYDSTSVAVPFSWSASAWHLDAQVAHTTTGLELTDRDDEFAANTADAKRDQARVVVRGEVGKQLELTGGGEWDRQEADTASAFGPGVVERRQRTWAAFGQASWSSGPLRIDAGLRRDDNDAFGAETSAKAGLGWAFSESWRLRASYGEAFRAPSLADLYYPGFSNPDLEPERTRSSEIAVDGGTGPFQASLALFENRLENLIEFDFVTFVPQNIGRARARGVEGSLAARFGIFDARLVATHLDAKDLETEAPLLRRADESATLTLFIRPGAFTAGVVTRYVGARIDFGDVDLDPFTTVDLSGAWRIDPRWEPFARVENVFDEKYEEAAGFPAPGLDFRVGINVSF
ncbi:MAG: TonB-dependent receptor, partial [Thermoanaerobaculia bacterium]